MVSLKKFNLKAKTLIMHKLILPSIEEVIQLNKSLGSQVVNKGILELILDKIKNKLKSKNLKKDLAYCASILWYDIITLHPFLNGNKRTATEVVKLFLKANGFALKMPYNGRVYISLKIANNDITRKELERLIYKNLEEINL